MSYSRREFNFAEAVTATLRSHGALDPWLDVQRLRPGADWAKELDEGLEAADALLLVASRAAIASAYVRREWSRALKRGIPIYIGVVEAVGLPDDLANAPVYDLRTRFWSRTAALGDVIAVARAEPTPAAPRPSRWGLPGRMPTPVAATAALSAIASIALVWAAALVVGLDIAVARLAPDLFSGRSWMSEVNAREGLRAKQWLAVMLPLLGITALIALLASSALRQCGGLLRRRSGWTLLVVGGGVSAVVGLALSVTVGLLVRTPPAGDGISASFMEEVFPVPPEIAADAGMLRTLLASAAVCAVVVVILAVRSRTLHLWLPTGEGADHHRGRITRTRLRWAERRQAAKELVDGDQRPLADWKGRDALFLVEWRVYFARMAALPATWVQPTVEVLCLEPADQPIAELLTAACREAGFAGGSSPARWVLVLVSSQVSWPEAAREMRPLGSRAICVIVDNVCLPDDAEELRRRQWLDFRERRPDSLFFLLSALRRPEAEPAGEGVGPTPIATDRFLAPFPVRWFVALTRAIPGFVSAFALVRLLFWPLDGRSVALAAVTVALCGSYWHLCNRVATRRITVARFRRASWEVWALSAVWAGLAISTLWTPLTMWINHGQLYPPSINARDEAILLAAVVALLSLGGAGACQLFQSPLAFWLPPAAGSVTSRVPRIGTGTWAVLTLLLAALGVTTALMAQFYVAYIE